MNQENLALKTRWAWVALSASLLVTGLVSLQVKKEVERAAVRQFAYASDQVALKVQERLAAQELILHGAAGLFNASKEVSRAEWRRYWEALKPERILPGVQGFGYSRLIPANHLASHIEQVRSEGFPAYVVRPAGARELYSSIVYLEPFRDRNLRAFGYDMLSEPVRRAALMQARDTGRATLSGKVELVQETGTEVQSGVLMYVPVYRNDAPTETVSQRQAALIGWAYSPYRMRDLMQGMLRQWPQQLGKDLHLRVYDGARVDPATALYNSQPDEKPHSKELFFEQRTIDFNGRQWLLAFDRDPTISPIDYTAVWGTLLGGILVSSLLFWLGRSLLDTRFQANRIAQNFTQDIRHQASLLKDSEQRFRGMVEQTISGMYVRRDGRFIYVNPRFCEITGWSAEELLQHDVLAFTVSDPDNLARIRQAWSRLDAGERNVTYSAPVRRKDGELIELGVNSSTITWDDGLPATIVMAQDITARKRAEDQIAAYVKQLEGSMRGTLQAVSNMVELRDPYTAGHERRVGLIAGAIAREMGWSAKRCEDLEMIGLVHDIGKIAVPSEILTKPGRLTFLEMELMKGHAQAGYDILKDVPFAAPVAEAILQHHERMDGSGYPRRLKGDEILPEARVLAVADVIESMAAHRPYRAALGLEVALAEVVDGRGRHYDPQVVDAAVRLVQEKKWELPQ